MVKLHFLWLCWGPILFAFSVAWLITHPDDWTGPATMIPISLAYGGVTYTLAFRWLKRAAVVNRQALIAGMIAGPAVGIILAAMLLSGVLD